MGGLHYTWHFRYFFTSAATTAGLTEDRRKFLREANLRFAKLPLNFLTKSLLSLSVRELLTASQRIQFVRAHSKSKYSSRAFCGQYKRPRACSSPAFSFYELSFLQPPLYLFVSGTSSHHVCDRSLPNYTSILLPQIQQHMKCTVSKITLLLFVDRNQYRRF